MVTCWALGLLLYLSVINGCWSSHCDPVEKNPTSRVLFVAWWLSSLNSIIEEAGSIVGFALWVKDLAL